ncbi:hypothetical protein OYE22_22510 [Streptomyces sp. 71268]|uniref:hypothetical protein n=1 Tax=Streptomyces sp. 71268 TaxID=3002640 RepID=UPI0023F794A3|nr:hypothetical protein [Streptomyces sp. 71268]WEV29920.1 hypothetical protein OYE22_22510 [Streptomyces sp. 71268]
MPTETPPPQRTALRQRLAELRGPRVAPRPLDARALAALAANPGCRRRALLDGAGVDKTALARALGSPAPFGQSQFAHQRGHVFEARVTADGGEQLVTLLRERLSDPGPPPPPGGIDAPELVADGPAGRTARTRLALARATTAGRWAVLRHPMVSVEVAGSPAYLEPDALVVHPDGSWTVVEIKSFPMLDGSADPTKVGAAARQAAVYVLALRELADAVAADGGPTRGAAGAPAGADAGLSGSVDGTVGAAGLVRQRALLVCPKDFSNLPTAELIDVRKQLSVTSRQLARLTRVEEIAAELPGDATFDLRLADDGKTPTRPVAELTATVDAVPAAYVPDCLASCELAFHCRQAARAAGAVEVLGRGVRGELGGLTTVEAVLGAALGEGPACDAARPSDPARATDSDQGVDTDQAADPAVRALRRAAALRAQALAEAGMAPGPAGRATESGEAGEAAWR